MSSSKFIEEVKLQLKQIPDIESFNRDGENILHQSVKRYCQIDVIKFLLSRGANLHNVTVKHRKSVIHLAVENMKKSNYNAIQRLTEYFIKQKINVNACDSEGNTALHYIVRNCSIIDQSISLANLLIQSGAQINATNNAGETALHLAIELGNFALSEYLISVGANVDGKTKQSKSALRIAVEKCNLQIINLLIQKGAQINNISNDEGSLLHIAIESSERGKLRIDLVKTLLESGAKIDACDSNLSTPLHLALREKDEECAKLFISLTSLIDRRDGRNNTPLRIAIKSKLENCVELLLMKGANPNDVKRKQESNFESVKSMMYHAVWSRKLSIVKLLFKFGANVSPEEKSHGLSISALRNDLAMAKYFLDKGADPNLWVPESTVALRSAIRITKNVPENMVQLLIDHGADAIKYSPLVENRGYCTKSVLCLIRQLAILTVEGADIGPVNLSHLKKNPLFEKYYLRCQVELLSMKSAQIPHSTLNLYDLLTKKNDEILMCFQNESIVALVKSEQVSSLYPRYLWNLRYKLTQAQERLDLMSKGRKFFMSALPTEVPVEIINLICELLSNEDLANLGKVRFTVQEKKKQFSMSLRTGRKKKNFLRKQNYYE